jgi:hypothetical protein
MFFTGGGKGRMKVPKENASSGTEIGKLFDIEQELILGLSGK